MTEQFIPSIQKNFGADSGTGQTFLCVITPKSGQKHCSFFMGKIKWKKSGRNFRVFPVRNGWHRSGKPDTDLQRDFLPCGRDHRVDHREEDEPPKWEILFWKKKSAPIRRENRWQLFRYRRSFCLCTQCGAGEGISYGKLCKHGSGFYLCFYPGRSGRGNRP